MESKIMGLCILACLLLPAVIIAGCTGTTPGPAPAPTGTTGPPAPSFMPVTTTPATPLTGSGKSVAEANNQFAYDLYLRLAGDPKYTGRNLFFSPFSISSAFGITYEGARGTTADEILSVFHFPADDAQRRTGFSAISSGLNAGDANYTLRTANALWAEKTYAFLPGYIGTAGEWYSANVTNLDFMHQPEASRQTINQWVADLTDNKILDLLPAGSIDTLTRLVITNAVYFKGTWVNQFDPNRTPDAHFNVSAEKTVPVKMMESTDSNANFRYTETGDLQVLSMPYRHERGRALSMTVLLPRGGNLTPAETALDPKNLSALQQSETYQWVRVYFPKFTLDTAYSLPGTLESMGMPTAFSASADFSGMDGTKDLYISDAVHKAYVSVDEQGTVAAAATGVVMNMKAAYHPGPIPEFRADHPFIFLITDDETGTILFAGRVMNPMGA